MPTAFTAAPTKVSTCRAPAHSPRTKNVMPARTQQNYVTVGSTVTLGNGMAAEEGPRRSGKSIGHRYHRSCLGRHRTAWTGSGQCNWDGGDDATRSAAIWCRLVKSAKTRLLWGPTVITPACGRAGELRILVVAKQLRRITRWVAHGFAGLASRRQKPCCAFNQGVHRASMVPGPSQPVATVVSCRSPRQTNGAPIDLLNGF